mmetsp:Transcript_23108/g.56991  ORF Transcript_23108/g.56991 Transcript_23108/m.56991 type:complete len:245 (-) Transcript_23108:635-1369(-)
MMIQKLFFLTVLVLACFVTPSWSKKKDYNAPHNHQGKLQSYEPGPFDLDLNKKELDTLGNGKPVMKQPPPKEGELGGGAICVQDVEAPKEAVWAQILDLDSYKGKVPKLNECKNYFLKKNEDGTFSIKTKMVVGILPGYSYTSHYDHKYDVEKNSVTWRLDYEKTSDFDDVSGHWHLEDHPEKPDCTRVFYSCDVMLKGAVPKPIANYLSKSALKTATGWVKKESEKNPAGKVPQVFESPAFVN